MAAQQNSITPIDKIRRLLYKLGIFKLTDDEPISPQKRMKMNIIQKENSVSRNQSPSPTPTSNQVPRSRAVGYSPEFIGPVKPSRNPRWEQWRKNDPKAFEQIFSATAIASEKSGIPQDLLMDIAGIESSGGQFMNQLSGGPGKGYYQFENPEPGYDPYSATSSASLAAKRIGNKQLSNWGYDEDDQMAREGRTWGSVDNPKNQNGRLTDFYNEQDLNAYLTKHWQF